MRAHVISIGSELIQGYLTDTNATFLAQELVGLGIELLHVTQVGDDRPRLINTLRTASIKADLVICTGGVGPTDDDLTREAIAELVGETPEVDPHLLDEIRAFFAGRGLTMADQNAKQAWLIPAAVALPNPVGTAPGWFVRFHDTIFIAMPGVPREMYRMWREQAVPRLQPLLPSRSVRSTTIKTLGIGESAVAQLLDDLIKRDRPVVATYAKDDGVHVIITATGPSAAEADALLRPARDEVRLRLLPYAYAEDDVSLPSALTSLLRKHRLTLSISEVGTGGRFGALLLSSPQAADVVRGCVSLPALQEPASPASELAKAAMERFPTTVGSSVSASYVTGERGLFEATVTIAIAVALVVEESFPLQATFDEVQRRSALHAADVLRRALVAMPDAL